MKVSAGVLIINPNHELLLTHPTGKKWLPGCWDIPKGCIDGDDEPLETAIREVKEETGLDIERFKNEFEDLGQHPYVDGKDIHLFKWRSAKTYDTKEMKCTTYFVGSDDVEYPEANDFRWVRLSMVKNYVFPSLWTVLEKLNIGT